jgi:ABC-type microcin C transport system duplicated ATPase subunit YejF
MNPILKVRDVCLSYHTLSGETPALSHISFQLMPGEFLAIVGPQCGQLKPRMLKIQRFWAYILDFFI